MFKNQPSPRPSPIRWERENGFTPWLKIRSDAFSNLEADETPDGDFVAELLGDGGDMFADANLGILLYESLVNEAIALKKLFQFAFDDFGERLRRLVLDLFGGDFLFFGQEVSGHLVPGNNEGMAGGNLQGDIFDQLFEIVLGNGAFFSGTHFHQHADFGAGMNVSSHQSIAADFHSRMARDPDVLANFRHSGFAVGIQIGLRVGRNFSGDLIGKGAEQVVAGNEIGFAVHLDKHPQATAGSDVLG